MSANNVAGALGRGIAQAGSTLARAATPTRLGILTAGAAAFAVADAAILYSRRAAMAGMYQNQLMFPSDLVQEQSGRNFYMSFNFQKYEKRSIANSPFLRSQGTVRLPIPKNIRDNLSVSYGSPSLSPVVGGVLESVIGTTPPGGGFLGSTGMLGTMVDRAGGALGSAAAGAVVEAAQTADAGRGILPAVSAYTGLAVNPYQTVLFEKPDFKSHDFSWEFMPRDENESRIVRDIIRTFQFHTSPGVSDGAGLFFSFPSMVIISLFPSSEFLYKFKPCVIKSVSVNYASGASPSFFKRTNAPSAVTINLNLQEIEYWTNKDYDPNNPTNVFDDEAALARNAERLTQAQRAENIRRAEESQTP